MEMFPEHYFEALKVFLDVKANENVQIFPKELQKPFTDSVEIILNRSDPMRLQKSLLCILRGVIDLIIGTHKSIHYYGQNSFNMHVALINKLKMYGDNAAIDYLTQQIKIYYMLYFQSNNLYTFEKDIVFIDVFVDFVTDCHKIEPKLLCGRIIKLLQDAQKINRLTSSDDDKNQFEISLCQYILIEKNERNYISFMKILEKAFTINAKIFGSIVYNPHNADDICALLDFDVPAKNYVINTFYKIFNVFISWMKPTLVKTCQNREYIISRTYSLDLECKIIKIKIVQDKNDFEPLFEEQKLCHWDYTNTKFKKTLRQNIEGKIFTPIPIILPQTFDLKCILKLVKLWKHIAKLTRDDLQCHTFTGNHLVSRIPKNELNMLLTSHIHIMNICEIMIGYMGKEVYYYLGDCYLCDKKLFVDDTSPYVVLISSDPEHINYVHMACLEKLQHHKGYCVDHKYQEYTYNTLRKSIDNKKLNA